MNTTENAPGASVQPVVRPTSEGWWWTRPDASCLWRIVEVTMIDGKPWIQEPGDEQADTPIDVLTWWQWVGPLTPPSGPNRPSSATRKPMTKPIRRRRLSKAEPRSQQRRVGPRVRRATRKKYGMTTIFGIRTKDRDWEKAGRDAARRMIKAFAVTKKRPNSVLDRTTSEATERK